MSEEATRPKALAGPHWLVRLAVFLGMNWITGIVGLYLSPGGAVQTSQFWLTSMLSTPLYAPLCAAFAMGGTLHSLVVFVVALIACYVGALFLICYYFGASTLEKWLLCCAGLAIELILALVGMSVFTNNMR